MLVCWSCSHNLNVDSKLHSGLSKWQTLDFSRSRAMDATPHLSPRQWRGCLAFVMSSHSWILCLSLEGDMWPAVCLQIRQNSSSVLKPEHLQGCLAFVMSSCSWVLCLSLTIGRVTCGQQSACKSSRTAQVCWDLTLCKQWNAFVFHWLTVFGFCCRLPRWHALSPSRKQCHVIAWTVSRFGEVNALSVGKMMRAEMCVFRSAGRFSTRSYCTS